MATSSITSALNNDQEVAPSSSLKECLIKELSEFFGLEEDSKNVQLWEEKRKRHIRRTNELSRPEAESYSTVSQEDFISDTVDADGTAGLPDLPSKDSIPKIAWDGITNVFGLMVNRHPRADEHSQSPDEHHPMERLSSLPDEHNTMGSFEQSTHKASSTSLQVEQQTGQQEVSNFEMGQKRWKGKMQQKEQQGEKHLLVEGGAEDRTYSNTEEIVVQSTHVGLHEDDKIDSSTGETFVQSTHAQGDLHKDTADASSKDKGQSNCCYQIKLWMWGDSNRQYGKGRFKNREMKEDKVKEVRPQLDDFNDYRPYFTWWVTTVQVIILLFSIYGYGLAPLDYAIHQQSGQVLMLSLSIQEVDYWEPSNFWWGPRAADLIHLGAKFAPCMRQDEKIFQNIEDQRQEELNTGCCIRNDNSGCVQTSRNGCSTRLSRWKKWTASMTGPDGRLSGSVCGLDPLYCLEPPSLPPHEWPDDITQWPICHKSSSTVNKIGSHAGDHMTCEVIGHPCCIGIHGECRITTKEYCDFARGYFHEEANLCSQVSCLNQVCGMIPFYNPDVPDQFYRLWMSLFIHAGVFHLLITVVLQLYLMRDIEKMAGPLRIGIIYIVSGIAGNLASSIFVPYRAEVGPSGSQFGLLACLYVEVLNSWRLHAYPWKQLGFLIGITITLFVIGLLPWVDNYAHIFGFIIGFLLSSALLPYVSFGGKYQRRKRILLICVCLLLVVVIMTTLFILFYILPIYECKICEYLNCIPFTSDFCAEQNINFNKKIEIL